MASPVIGAAIGFSLYNDAAAAMSVNIGDEILAQKILCQLSDLKRLIIGSR
jgi:hypothetical protein